MRKTIAKGSLASSIVCLATAAVCNAAEDPNNINNYLVDITAGAVSAAGIASLDSGITTIETAQDLVVAIQPLTSADQKSAFGLAITPAKTTLFPMPGDVYVKNSWWRLLGNLTLSYAQNEAELSGQTYQKRAISLDTVYFFRLQDDPVYAASDAFQRCSDDTAATVNEKLSDLLQRKVAQKITEVQFKEEQKKILGDRGTETRGCIADELSKAPWNSGRLSISVGQGRLRGIGSSYSLGRQFNLNAQYPAGTQGLIQVSLRRANRALDTDTLGQPQVDFKSSRLAAVRYTYGGEGSSALRVLVEASNAKSSSANAFRDAFMYALGVDKKLAKGMWLEFRLGRSRANDSGTEQTSGLLSLNLAPSLFEFKK